MSKLTEFTRYDDAHRVYSSSKLWELFDGDREWLNIAHECLDRHAESGEIAVRIAHADGRDEVLTFNELAEASSRFAHWLEARGIQRGDRIAIMLDPSAAFYAVLFGVMKRGAIAVPLFTLFGPDGLRHRVLDATPQLLVVRPDHAAIAKSATGVEILIADDSFPAVLAQFPAQYQVATRPDDLAIFQYTSGTTRGLPDAVRHAHRAIVTVMAAALYGTGIRPGDRYFCPSSPGWGHGLWHGTLAPLAMGVTTGTCAGRFDPLRLLRALRDYRVTNLSATPSHYRMIRNTGRSEEFEIQLRKLSFTGEPIDTATRAFLEQRFGLSVCSMYGTTEVGVILADYPGADDYAVRPGSLGKPVPGMRVEVHRPDGASCSFGEVGEIRVLRRDGWFPTKDLGCIDEDGYFYHAGRADDVIISAGWTMGAVEIEDALLKHADVREAAVIGVPDPMRGQVIKAFIVSDRGGDDGFVRELQDLVRTQLSQHEYPRLVAFVAELPKTPAGKVARYILRQREAGLEG